MAEEALGTGELDLRELSTEERDKLLGSRAAEEVFDIPAGLTEILPGDIETADTLAGETARTTAPIDNYPYRAIAFINVDRAQGFAIRGTAFFVSKYVLATAAHNLPPNLTSISVYPKLNGSITGPPYITSNYRVSPYYAGDTTSDYGIVILQEPVGAATGWFIVPEHPPLPPQNGTVLMSGYPRPGLLQREGSGAIVDLNARTLLYGIDTEPGDSGAPVWMRTPGLPLLVGIHRAENGIAVPANNPVARQILSWI